MRLISSGMRRSKLRKPASTCAMGMPSFAATSDTATVELTSPTTKTTSGLLFNQHRLDSFEYFRGLRGMGS